jgi:hypothetical protein
VLPVTRAVLPLSLPSPESVDHNHRAVRRRAIFAPVSLYCEAGVYRHNLRLRRQVSQRLCHLSSGLVALRRCSSRPPQILSKGKGKAKSQ